MSAASRPKLNRQQLAEALDSMAEWFPEEKTRLVKHREAIIRHVLEGTAPGANSPLLREKTTLMTNEMLVESAAPLSPCLEAILMFVVDAVFFVLGLLGLHVSNQERIARALFRELGVDTLRGLQRAIHNFNEAEGATKKAKALFAILGGIYKAGGFGAVFKVLKDEMSWWEWVKTGVVAVAQLTAWFATDGAAFIAEAVLSIMSATTLIEAGIKVDKACS